jgi:hypothetical protein
VDGGARVGDVRAGVVYPARIVAHVLQSKVVEYRGWWEGGGSDGDSRKKGRWLVSRSRWLGGKDIRVVRVRFLDSI